MISVNELAARLALKPFNLDDGDREVTGGYAGDLLSWVMGRATSGDAWVTIMSNINVIAVAQLTDVACVILAEGVEPGDDLVSAAKTRGVNLFSSEEAAFDLCGKIYALIAPNGGAEAAEAAEEAAAYADSDR